MQVNAHFAHEDENHMPSNVTEGFGTRKKQSSIFISVQTISRSCLGNTRCVELADGYIPLNFHSNELAKKHGLLSQILGVQSN